MTPCGLFNTNTLFLPHPSAERKWFTDEPENAYPRNIQIKPMSTHMANQVNQYKSTSSLIPPIREVEDECWKPGPLDDSWEFWTLLRKEIRDGEQGGWWWWLIVPHSFYRSRVWHKHNNWKGPPMCIPVMLLPCSSCFIYQSSIEMYIMTI